jgi:hypothetical protein
VGLRRRTISRARRLSAAAFTKGGGDAALLLLEDARLSEQAGSIERAMLRGFVTVGPLRPLKGLLIALQYHHKAQEGRLEQRSGN